MYKRQTKYILTILFTLALAGFIACEGPEGPQGEQGLQGEQGPQGPVGQDGNADVTQYNYAAFTHDGGIFPVLFDIPVTWDVFQESLVLCYAQDGNRWFPIPGFVDATSPKNYYRSIFRSRISEVSETGELESRMRLQIESSLSVGGAKNFNGLRIIVAPAATVENLKLNFNDYEKVRKFFGLSE